MEAATSATFASDGVAAALHLADAPEALLEQREALGDDCQLAVKRLFDLAKQLEPKTFTPLAELLVEGFTLDQIWEQIDLYNAPLLKYSQRGLKKHFAKPASVSLPVPDSESDEGDDGDEGSDGDETRDGAGAAAADDPYAAFRGEGDSDDDELAGSSEDDDMDPEAAAARVRRRLRAEGKGGKGGKGSDAEARRERKKRHGMENSFFSLDDMEKFMDEAEEEYMNEYEKADDEDGDHGDDAGWSYQEGDDDDAVPYNDDEGLFSELQSEEELDEDGDGDGAPKKSSAEMTYADFFDPPDKVDGKEDVEIGFNPEYGPAEKDAAAREGGGEEADAKADAGSDDGEGNDDFPEEDYGDEEEEEEEEEEDEDGVGGFDSLRTEEDAQMDAGAGRGASASAADAEEEELDGELGPRSAFERVQAKIGKQMKELEERNIGEKQWETKGEIKAKERPENSLLSSVLDFQHAGKVKPVRIPAPMPSCSASSQ
jgi:U3 small nucleolar RNA-associated protein MPP10